MGTLPLRAAVLAAAVTVAVLLANRVIIRLLAQLEWPIAVYVVLSATLAYGSLGVMCRWISQRFGTGSMRHDLGLAFRPIDLGWGVVTWLLSLGVQLAVGIIVLVSRIPVSSNTKGIDASGSERGYVISLLVVAVVAAPIVEELVFRGVVLRGLASRLPVVAAVGVQGLLFGAVHADPRFGWGNIGLVIVLGAVGTTFGAMAVVVRRLAPTMIAHGILNAVALAIALSGLVDS